MAKKYFIVDTVAGDFILTKAQLQRNAKKIMKYHVTSKKRIDTYQEFLKKVV